MISLDIKVWLATLLYLMWFSQLIRRNPISEFSEYLLVGLANALVTVGAFWSLYGTIKSSLGAGDFLIIIPVILGIGVFGRLTTSYAWVGRWSIALIVGVSAAMATRGAVESEILSQLYPTFKNLFVAGDPFGTVNGVIIFIGMITTISYFTFFIKREGPVGGTVGKLAYWGRAFMMLFFGASVGQMYVNRANYLIGIAKHILITTLGLGPA